MRVLVSLVSTLRAKTGVGHYTAQLFDGLRRLAHPDRIDGYPSRSVTLARRGWAWVRGRAAATAPATTSMAAQPASNPDETLRPGLRQRAVLALSRFGRGLLERHERRCFFERGYDLYHEPNFIPLPSSYATISTLHDLSGLLHPDWHPAARVAWYEQNFPRSLRQSTAFVAVSEFTRQEVIRVLGIAPQRVVRIYNGVGPAFRPLPAEAVTSRLRRLGLPSQYLLYVGTVEPRKNVLRLLQAYCTLPASLRERWPLVLAGGWGWHAEPEQEYYHAEARHRGVRHLGYVADADLPALYNGARALVYPSYYEGFGLPPMEMLACGGAVLASTAAALVETVGPCAHLAPAEDVDGWRAALHRVVTDDAWWHDLRRGAVAHAQPFTWERSAAEHLALYRAVAAGRYGMDASGRRAA